MVVYGKSCKKDKVSKGDISSILSLICFCLIYLPYLITTVNMLNGNAPGSDSPAGGYYIIYGGLMRYLPTLCIYYSSCKAVKLYSNCKEKNIIRNVINILNIVSIVLMSPYIFFPIILLLFVCYIGVIRGEETLLFYYLLL